jgi:hypothetical protein
MMLLLAILLLLATLTAASWALFGMLDNIAIPMSCPHCMATLARNSTETWHERRAGVLRCRWCKTTFVEHSDGSISPELPTDS